VEKPPDGERPGLPAYQFRRSTLICNDGVPTWRAGRQRALLVSILRRFA
jgi:hypothetical protein